MIRERMMAGAPGFHRRCAGLLLVLATISVMGCASRGGAAPTAAGDEPASAGAIKPKNVSPMLAPVAADYFMPASAFDATGNRATPQAAPLLPQPGGRAAPDFKAQVLLYHSPASAAYFKRGGVDGSFNLLVWERFLRKYRMPYRVVKDVAVLAQSAPGVLVLPSDIALTALEREAIAGYRRRGGSVFASWMVGTRDEAGAWQGFGYMESLLGLRVAGNTGPHEEQRYLNPYADTEIGHSIPAGTRMWTERADGYWMLRVAGGRHAALVTDWGRNMPKPTTDTVVAYDEASLAGGPASRMVYFGWPERLWLAMDPKKHEGLLYDAMMWLLRQPAAYLATWPYPYRSAYLPLVYMADVFNDNDLPFARQLKDNGLRGSYYILSMEIDKSADALRRIHALGHSLNYQGDVYEGFKDQPLEEQRARMDRMRSEIAAQKIPVESEAGFAPPMDDTDANTYAAAASQPFGHMLTWIANDGCVPYLHAGQGAGRELILLPRIHPGAEEMLEDVDEDAALETLRTQVDAGDRMGCLNVLRFANQSLLSSHAKDGLIALYSGRKARMWSTSGVQVARWWRTRRQIDVEITGTESAPVLSVSNAGGTIDEDAAIWINLPDAGTMLQLSPIGNAPPLKPAGTDGARAAFLLRGLPGGQFQWSVQLTPR